MTFKEPTLQEAKDAAFRVGIPDDKAEQFYHHYNAQGWLRANGLPVTNLESILVCWRNNQYKFEDKAKKKIGLFPIGGGRICNKKHCKMPAVYKDTSGAYDSFYCEEHMPEQVKAKYGH